MLTKFAVPVVVLFSIFMFFWRLDSTPPGFYIDESLHAYNAVSILETGKDEYGKSFPILFRFYGSYNEPLYVYLTAIAVLVFGETLFAARFVSALAGLLTVLVLYFLLIKITKNKFASFTTSMVLPMCPWLLLYSRTGFEVVTAFLLFVLGIVTFYLSLEKPKYIIVSYVLFSLSTYAAYTERFVSPLLALVLTVLFRKYVLAVKNRKYVLIGLFGVLISQLPHLFVLFTPAFFLKGDLLFQGLPLLNFGKEFLSHYSYYFSPEALFFKGDPDPQRSVPEVSTFPFWLVIPYIIGWIHIFKHKQLPINRLVLATALIAPIPAALTHDPFATHRAMPLFAPLVLVIGLGINEMVTVAKPLFRKFSALALILVTGFLVWRSFFVLLPGERGVYWGSQYVDLAKIISTSPDTKFVVDQGRLKIAYATLAYLVKVDPGEFQSTMATSVRQNYYFSTDYHPDYHFANIQLRSINWEEDVYGDLTLVGDTLSISDAQAKEHFLVKQFEITDSLGNVLLQGYSTNPKLKCKMLEYLESRCKNVS